MARAGKEFAAFPGTTGAAEFFMDKMLQSSSAQGAFGSRGAGGAIPGSAAAAEIPNPSSREFAAGALPVFFQGGLLPFRSNLKGQNLSRTP